MAHNCKTRACLRSLRWNWAWPGRPNLRWSHECVATSLLDPRYHENIMQFRPTAFFVFAAATLFAQGRPVTPADQAAGQVWWAHVKALADDSMQGRLTGSRRLSAAPPDTSSRNSTPPGCSPAGAQRLLPAGEVRRDPRRSPISRPMALLVDGRNEPLVLGRDAILGLARTQPQVDHCSARVHRLRPPSAGSEVRRFRFGRSCPSPP